VLVGDGALERLDGFLTGRVVVVADEAVPVLPELEAIPGPVLRLAGGEAAKTMAGVSRLLLSFEENRVGRDGTIVAVGGGTIGDLAGFAASIWLRGVAVVQVPSTLLAMVDSAVGGKTGINTALAKNAVGTFWQPRAVLADTRYLASLPEEQVRGGQAEIIKYTMTLDPGMLELKDLDEIIERCVRCKARVVVEDEREAGLREVLNYGHTVGHAIESASGYALHHGRAVAAGMRAAARISAELGLCERSLVEAQDELLAAHGLPGPLPELTVDQVLEATVADKKSRAGRLRWVLLREMGRAELGQEVPDDIVRRAVTEILSS
jgi:3-dehydroquinate synthase